MQPFFNNSRDYISAQEVTFKIDNNKAKLSRNDAKFYVITVSPSSRELEKMGKTEKEQAEAMRKYVRDDVMQHYAEGFGKGLNKEDHQQIPALSQQQHRCHHKDQVQCGIDQLGTMKSHRLFAEKFDQIVVGLDPGRSDSALHSGSELAVNAGEYDSGNGGQQEHEKSVEPGRVPAV